MHHKFEQKSQTPQLKALDDTECAPNTVVQGLHRSTSWIPGFSGFENAASDQHAVLQGLHLSANPRKQSIDDYIEMSSGTPTEFERFKSSKALQASDSLCPIAERQSRLQLQLSKVQKDSIKFITSVNEDSVVILPTGSGKTRIVEFFGGFDGVAIVISPFQKLSNQLESVLGESAFRWPLIGCSETICLASARFIIVAVEHCEYSSPYLQFLRRLSQSRGISKLFVDEVHHLLEAKNTEFRKCLGNFWTFRSKLLTNGVNAQVVGLTATLRQSDIIKLRQLVNGSSGTMPVFRQSCYRSSIRMELVWASNVSEAQRVCINDSRALAERGKTIVFGTSLHMINLLAEMMDCQQITSGIELDLERFEKTKVVVASSCAGHGLDLRNIQAVCILGIPHDAETLIQ
jgi:superfamily II DNA or RNA helicase